MDDKRCWRGTVFVERLLHCMKYEEVHLEAYESISAARQGIDFYDTRRPHQSHNGRTPDMIYFKTL